MDGHQTFWNGVQDYDSQVFSVFADPGVDNPIFAYLAKKTSNKTVADLGCGQGNFLPYLAAQFDRVIAVDYSDTLLQQAAERYSGLNNVEYRRLDLRDMSELYGMVDIAVSVNSILPETISDVERIISEIFNVIKNGGEFVGILPSADVVQHLALLEQRKLIQEGFSEDEATCEIERRFCQDRQFHMLGFHRDSIQDPRQKYFFEFEIYSRLLGAGFHDVNVDKVYYSWEYCRDHHYGYFPGEERIWDWFVTAKKLDGAMRLVDDLRVARRRGVVEARVLTEEGRFGTATQASDIHAAWRADPESRYHIGRRQLLPLAIMLQMLSHPLATFKSLLSYWAMQQTEIRSPRYRR